MAFHVERNQWGRPGGCTNSSDPESGSVFASRRIQTTTDIARPFHTTRTVFSKSFYKIVRASSRQSASSRRFKTQYYAARKLCLVRPGVPLPAFHMAPV